MHGNKVRILFFLVMGLVLPVAQAAKPHQDPGYGFDRGHAQRAERDDRGDRYRPAPQREERRPGLAAAVAEAQRRTGGRVLAAEPQEDANGRYYRIKVLTPDGRIQILHIGER